MNLHFLSDVECKPLLGLRQSQLVGAAGAQRVLPHRAARVYAIIRSVEVLLLHPHLVGVGPKPGA
eukprot:CAMPEP_0205894616 /NCGR_PEP_ID=MMETSP1083-20121108/23934_1 /ASSEMBLY_ACC=CAM_ASM_000430 /TAXON_ID=97485 /ORGANISM="Prymnesium parvum, Strain Texoma1" /LENGTH=64 /DNA_ID=CAMNT_0053259471 /DNA_START=621 /DNA_END=815 /DNA_ORIENTATION=-